MTETAVRVTTEDGVRRIVMDRPPLNILDIAMMEASRANFGSASCTRGTSE